MGVQVPLSAPETPKVRMESEVPRFPIRAPTICKRLPHGDLSPLGHISPHALRQRGAEHPNF